MEVIENGKNFVLKVPSARKAEIANLMAYRGLTFSTSASSRAEAVLWATNVYALADLAGEEDVPDLVDDALVGADVGVGEDDAPGLACGPQPGAGGHPDRIGGGFRGALLGCDPAEDHLARRNAGHEREGDDLIDLALGLQGGEHAAQVARRLGRQVIAGRQIRPVGRWRARKHKDIGLVGRDGLVGQVQDAHPGNLSGRPDAGTR